jgi:hypothetical protein
VLQLVLHRAVLLEQESRKYFHISSVSVGPKRSQRQQTLHDMCQHWQNPATANSATTAAANATAAEKVYRIKVRQNAD